MDCLPLPLQAQRTAQAVEATRAASAERTCAQRQGAQFRETAKQMEAARAKAAVQTQRTKGDPKEEQQEDQRLQTLLGLQPAVIMRMRGMSRGLSLEGCVDEW